MQGDERELQEFAQGRGPSPTSSGYSVFVLGNTSWDNRLRSGYVKKPGWVLVMLSDNPGSFWDRLTSTFTRSR